MSRQIIIPNRKQSYLFSVKLSDHLGEKHEIHSFIKLLDSVDIKPFMKHYSNLGGKAYHPYIILGILLYGFHI